ncbi:hypothetical protein [Sporolactobacillus terrae]|uniref:hypothetical protein n=1 Tax=Sporolactobacillus terrae TaxID=269673 RepID=UPI0005683325|nr:hypothetical protein [Sporolactobacillus terrae]
MAEFISSALLEWSVYAFLGIIMFFVIDWVTGDGSVFSGRNQDERTQMIKKKSIVSSWLVLLLLFVSNFARHAFHLGPILDKPLRNPEGFYLAAALLSYFIFYAYNSWKMKA